MKTNGQIVKKFYEKNPFLFSDLTKIETKIDLCNSASQFAKSLNDEIPIKKRVIDLGCGTGKLSSYLSIKKRYITGIDFSKPSIDYANKLKNKLNLKNVKFIRRDIFNLKLPKESFDYSISLGVLHHTKSPYEGFKIQCDLTKPGGFVIIGLYNNYGRILTKIKKYYSKISNNYDLDYFTKEDLDEKQKKIWIQDQYNHPLESTHTIDEILKWFELNDIELLNSLPRLSFSTNFEFKELFEKHYQHHENKRKLKHFLIQINWMLNSTNNGFFVLIGRKSKI